MKWLHTPKLSRIRAEKGEGEKTTKISRELKRLIQKEAELPFDEKLDFWLKEPRLTWNTFVWRQ